MMDPEEAEAAMAALQHIQDTLGSVKGLKPPDSSTEAPSIGGPPEAGESEPIDDGETPEEESAEAEAEAPKEPEPERFIEALGRGDIGGKPTSESIAAEIVAPKRGRGRPPKARY